MLKLFSLFVLFIAVHSEVTKYTVRDEEGGQDWIIEMKGDVIIDQYREGVSWSNICEIVHQVKNQFSP